MADAESVRAIDCWITVFIVVRNAAVHARLGELVRAVWEGGVRDVAQQHLGERFFTGVEGHAVGASRSTIRHQASVGAGTVIGANFGTATSHSETSRLSTVNCQLW